jgi:HEPN domain-containing protein
MNLDKKDHIKKWLFRAKEDLSVINRLAEEKMEFYTSTICFHAQQSVEKNLKAFLVYHDVDFPRTHDVDFLLNECQKIDQASFGIDLKSLTEYGVSVRYPDDFFIPGVKETKEYVEIANMVNGIVESLIQLI